MISCPKCQHSFYAPAEGRHRVIHALQELVDLKRMKDAGLVTPEYERRKLLAWREAYRILGFADEPKP